MSDGATNICPACGASASGNYCARCGAPLGDEAPRRTCPSCGRPAAAEALYCDECGTPLRGRPHKPAAAYAPWVLAGLALVAFSIAIVLFIQRQSGPRMGDAPITGGVPGRDAAAPGEAGPGSGTMPTSAELAAMSPAEAAGRLFDRTMRLREAGDTARARFFAEMGLQAYARVPAAQRDADVRLHRGLLHLTLGRPEAAGEEADSILAAAAEHPYGLLLALRAAEARGERAAAQGYRRRLARALNGGAVPPEEYAPHEAILRAEVGETGSGDGS